MLNELNKEMPEESVLVVDCGFAAHRGGLLYHTKKAVRRFVADRRLSSIGYGLPGAYRNPMIALTGCPPRSLCREDGQGKQRSSGHGEHNPAVNGIPNPASPCLVAFADVAV